MAPELNRAKMEAFGGQALDILNKGSLAVMMSLGHRTGLFDAMAALPPSTSQQIADSTNLNERYIREWLGAMVTGKIVDYDSARATYHLPREHAAFLTRAAETNNVASFAQLIPLISNVEDPIVDCFRRGGGVPYSAFHRFAEVMRELSAPTCDTLLVQKILPLAPGLVEALRRGIDVLEVGCGSGQALNVMAKAFPQSRFTGYDLLPDQIAAAQAQAAERGIANVRFAVQDVAVMPHDGGYDLITAFDTVHDQAHPGTLLGHIAAALKPGGTFLMWDINASSDLHANRDHLLGPFLYGVSCMHCMTVSLSQDGEGLGAVWGRQKAIAMLTAAGFSAIEVHEIEEDPINSCYVAQKSR